MRAECNFSLFVSGHAEMDKEKFRPVENRLYVVVEIFCTLKTRYTNSKMPVQITLETTNFSLFSAVSD